MLTEPTDDILERIANAHWNGGKGEGIKFHDIHQINACNHVLSGTIDDGGITYGFIIEMGDIVGTDVKEWGCADDVGCYTPPPPNPKTFIPADPFPSEFILTNYFRMRETSWFKEQEGKYNYDAHFQPGVFIENHYSKWASQHGLRCGYMSDVPERTPHASR